MDQPHHINEDIAKVMKRLEFENQELKVQLNELNKKVKEMIAAKDIWVKDTKNYQKKQIFFAKEKQVKELVYPKHPSQSTFDWLAQ